MIQEVKTKPPKFTGTDLIYKGDMYIVQNGLLFDYYPIKTRPLIADKIFYIEISPSVVRDGYMCIDKKIYSVSAEDIIKRKVYAYKQYSNKQTTSSNVVQPSGAISDKPQQKLSIVSGTEIDEDANLAWENQIDSLLQNIAAKTGEAWEVSYNPQPRQRNEDGAISYFD